MLLPFLLVCGVALIAGYVLLKNESPAGKWLLLASCLGILIGIYVSAQKEMNGRPQIGEEFDTAVAWALADALAEDQPDGGAVLVIQDPIYKTTPSYEAQREGIRRGLPDRFDARFVDLSTSVNEGELLDPKKVQSALASLEQEAVALISLTPIAEFLGKELLNELPALYLMELEKKRQLRLLLRDEQVQAAVINQENANMAVRPKGDPEADFALRFQIIRP